MAEIFRLKVASRRQVTLPTRVMELLHLSEGDVLEISVEENLLEGRGLKLVPTKLFTAELLSELKKREEEMTAGLALDVANRDELSKVRKESSAAGTRT